MVDVSHNFWDSLNHPYRMLEHHYCEEGWERVKKNQIKVWSAYGPVSINDEIDWHIDPFNDETWMFYFHGLNWLYSYLWAIDNCDEDASRIFDILDQHYSHINSDSPNKMVWFDHATSDRLSILSAISLHPCIKSAKPKSLERIQWMIDKHIEAIIGFKDSKRWIDSNHGIFHSLALINASEVKQVFNIPKETKELGLKYLSDTIGTIFSIEEGISLEQSAYYHQLGISLVESLKETELQFVGISKNDFIDDLRNSNYWLTSTNKKLIAIGDTSCISNISENHQPILTPNNWNKSFPKAGFSVAKYRCTNNLWNHFCMLHRPHRAPHGHFDALSITLSKGNKEFLIDCGGPYRYGDKMRFSYFLSSFSHNVAIINGKKHEKGATLISANTLNDGSYQVTAEHSGYTPIIHRRTCIYEKNKGLKVIDSFKGIKKSTQIELLWHFHPDCSVSGDFDIIQHDSQKLYFRSKAVCERRLVSGVEEGTPQGWVTEGIGGKTPCPTIIDTYFVNSDAELITYFEYDGKRGLDDILSNEGEFHDSGQNTDLPIEGPFEITTFDTEVINKYISNNPFFWSPGDYFGDRNIWKINRAMQKLSHPNLSSNEVSEFLFNNVKERVATKASTIYIISNGSSGCQYLGGLISMHEKYHLIDEVYFPPSIINVLGELDEESSKCLIELVNYTHVGDDGTKKFSSPVNTMHLRKDTPLSIIEDYSGNPKFIFLLRNPINIAISRGLRKQAYKEKDKKYRDVEINKYLKMQARYTKNHFTRLFTGSTEIDKIVVRYEELIENTEQVLVDIFKHIGSEIPREDVSALIKKYESWKDFSKNEHKMKIPNLTKEQKTILLEELSGTCIELGYELPDW